MKVLILLACLSATRALGSEAETLCASNPAFSSTVMLSVVQSQLAHDHDAALDADTPENLARQAAAQGIAECAADIRADPSIATAFAGVDGRDRETGWDAYNTACADRKTARGACITAEIGAYRALRHMMTTDTPPGAKALVQTCELVMQSDPAMAEWRACVDHALAVHASADAARRCKVSASWHVARTGAEAGQVVAECLRR
jgi:hypothetical protein